MDSGKDTSDRRSRRRWIANAVAGVSTLHAQTRSPVSRTLPNILYLHSHDTGRYIEPYGYSVPTPNLAKLASQGILFRNAFDAAPTCSPARASLLTGHCPHNNGMLGLAHRGFALSDYKQHIAHTIRPQGYRSSLIGIQHIATDPSIIGYDEVVQSRSSSGVPQTGAGRTPDIVSAAVNKLRSRPKEPFFLDVGFFETHREFRKPGPQEHSGNCQPPATVPDIPATREDMAAYKASARVLDSAYGEILTALETSGLADNTLVICTTDHGIPFPGMKCNLTVHGTGVLLIMRGPGGFTGGKVSDAMVSHMDLYPTICEMLNVEKPAWLQGKSMLPLIRGEKPEINDELFAEVNYHAAYEPKRSVRTRRYNYVRHFDGRTRPVLPNCDDGLSKSVWLKHGWADRAVPQEALFDCVFDPNESNNLAHDPAMRSVVSQMRGRLDSWMERTNDPLLKGPVPAPPGAIANDPDGISPKDKPRAVTRA